jgi:hypothetical protein
METAFRANSVATKIPSSMPRAGGITTHCIEKVQQCKKIGVEQLLCLMQNYGIPQEKTMQSMRLWGEKVIPHCK